MGEVKIKAEKTRSDVLPPLRERADQLDDSGDITLTTGEQQVRLNPIERVTFELEDESNRSEGDTEAKRSIESELASWREARTQNGKTLATTATGASC